MSRTSHAASLLSIGIVAAKRSTPVLLALLLSACFSLQLEDWPDNIPPSQLFVDAWQDDPVNQQVQPMDEYLYWVRAFYKGTVVYPRGWLQLESELLALVEDDAQPALAEDLYDLGIVIGAEWSKVNEGRLIDNRLLALWGTVLQMSLTVDKELEAVTMITGDVQLLIAGNLLKDDIFEARYADQLGYELFDDFGDF